LSKKDNPYRMRFNTGIGVENDKKGRVLGKWEGGAQEGAIYLHSIISIEVSSIDATRITLSKGLVTEKD
jgi:hypothetical protein